MNLSPQTYLGENPKNVTERPKAHPTKDEPYVHANDGHLLTQAY